jgi:hypothetical protein
LLRKDEIEPSTLLLLVEHREASRLQITSWSQMFGHLSAVSAHVKDAAHKTLGLAQI